MSDVATKSKKGGGYDLRSDKELVKYLLENAEVEFEELGDLIETETGVRFLFNTNEDELVAVDHE